MARHIAAFYLPELSYERDKGIVDKEPATTQMLKNLLVSIAQGRVDPILFSREAQAEMVPFIQRIGPNYLRPLGTLKSLVLLEVRDEKTSRIYRYRAIFPDASLLWTFTLNREGKISSLQPTGE
jgi:hypothetical protein